jgi:hypothetical protein
MRTAAPCAPPRTTWRFVPQRGQTGAAITPPVVYRVRFVVVGTSAGRAAPGRAGPASALPRGAAMSRRAPRDRQHAEHDGSVPALEVAIGRTHGPQPYLVEAAVPDRYELARAELTHPRQESQRPQRDEHRGHPEHVDRERDQRLVAEVPDADHRPGGDGAVDEQHVGPPAVEGRPGRVGLAIHSIRGRIEVISLSRGAFPVSQTRRMPPPENGRPAWETGRRRLNAMTRDQRRAYFTAWTADAGGAQRLRLRHVGGLQPPPHHPFPTAIRAVLLPRLRRLERHRAIRGGTDPDRPQK